MKAFQKRVVLVSLVLAASFAVAGYAADKAQPQKGASDVIEKSWEMRCENPKDTKKGCEVFDRLEVKSSQTRIAEFAVGFPEDGKKDVARGVVVLPLGILLEPGIAMKIDDGKPVSFKSRFCTNAGCFSYITLDKGMLNSMKNGKMAKFAFKSADNQNVNVEMKLEGFGKALQQIE